MQPKEQTKPGEQTPAVPLSETISNAHSSGNGALRLSEDGPVEPSGETLADAEANKELQPKGEEY